MKKNKKELRDFLQKILNEIKFGKEAPLVEPDKEVKPTTPTTPPQPQRRRKLVPDKWPEHAPKPKPKAESEEKIDLEECLNQFKKIHNYIRNKELISENKRVKNEMAMNIDDPGYDLPHPSVKRGIEGDKETAFTGLDFFQGGSLDYSTLEKLGSEEFNKIIADVKPFGKMSMDEFAQAFKLMASIEMPNKTALENLAIKKVKEQFGLPDEVAQQLDAKLVQDIPKSELDNDSDNLVDDVEEELEFNDEEKKIISQHIEKRKIQNALSMGAGFRAHSVFNSIKDDLDAIDEKLYPLYEKTMPNVALFMWKTPLEDMMGGVHLMGTSKIKMEKKQENKPEEDSQEEPQENNLEVRAEAQAVIFPILLHETAKAAIELLFANYLISLTEKYGANVAREIINKSDIFEEEIWMKRIGPTLWKYLHDVIDYVIVHEHEGDYTLVSYLLHDISMMEPKEFVKFMNDVVYNGNKSISKIKEMIEDIEDDINSEEPLPAETDVENLEDNIENAGQSLVNLAKQAMKKDTQKVEKNFEDMSLNELQGELQNAIDEERYEDASKIVKLIDKLK